MSQSRKRDSSRGGQQAAQDDAAGRNASDELQQDEEDLSEPDPADEDPAPSSAQTDILLAEQRDKYLRLAAEYDNFRKRTARERIESHARGQAELAKQLLDPLDDLGRFAHLDPQSVDSATVVQGAEMVEKKLLKVLGAAGLQVVNPVNQTFDPTLHEAVMTEPALSAEDDDVVSRVFQQGYVFNGQLLRPARVVVKQWNG